MKITDQQFIEAMSQAVCEKGKSNVAPGAYWSYGAAFCIVGYALYSIAPELCPRDNKHMAQELLTGLGLSERVAAAGVVAQHTNDGSWHWGDVLAAFQIALEEWRPGMRTSDLVGIAVTKADRGRWREVVSVTGWGGGTVSVSQLNQFGGSMTAAAASASAVMAQFNSVFASAGTINKVQPVSTQVALKKDHALTA